MLTDVFNDALSKQPEGDVHGGVQMTLEIGENGATVKTQIDVSSEKTNKEDEKTMGAVVPQKTSEPSDIEKGKDIEDKAKYIYHKISDSNLERKTILSIYFALKI